MSISAPVFIGSGSAATGTTVSLTTNQTVPVGALICVLVNAQVTTGGLTGVTDGTNGYALAWVNNTAGFPNVAYSPSIGAQLAAGTTITATHVGTNPGLHMAAFYVMGLAAAGVVEFATGITGGPGTSTGTLTGGTLSTANEFVAVILGVNGASLTGNSITGNLPYVLGVQLDALVPNMELWYLVTSTPTPPPPPTASASWSSPAANWGLTMVSFIGASVVQTFANTPCGMGGG